MSHKYSRTGNSAGHSGGKTAHTAFIEQDEMVRQLYLVTSLHRPLLTGSVSASFDALHSAEREELLVDSARHVGSLVRSDNLWNDLGTHDSRHEGPRKESGGERLERRDFRYPKRRAEVGQDVLLPPSAFV